MPDTLALPRDTLTVIDESDLLTCADNRNDKLTFSEHGYLLCLSATGIRDGTYSERMYMTHSLDLWCASTKWSSQTDIDASVETIADFVAFLDSTKDCGKVVFLKESDLAAY